MRTNHPSSGRAPRPDPTELLKRSGYRITWRDRFDDLIFALRGERFVGFYLGFYAGCMTTVGLAMLWARFGL